VIIENLVLEEYKLELQRILLSKYIIMKRD
jgi:hypothetical protein